MIPPTAMLQQVIEYSTCVSSPNRAPNPLTTLREPYSPPPSPPLNPVYPGCVSFDVVIDIHMYIHIVYMHTR